LSLAEYLSDQGSKSAEQRGSKPRPSSFDEADADFQQLLVNFLHNGMYAREVIPQSMRELLSVALLTALHHSDAKLADHIDFALNLNPEAVVKEAILQTGVYAGLPAASNGMRVYGEVIRRRRAEQEAGALAAEA
jgi:alkylhydroperoxidase/carboxymuconolactone decarboxylase family protein YurZ